MCVLNFSTAPSGDCCTRICRRLGKKKSFNVFAPQADVELLTLRSYCEARVSTRDFPSSPYVFCPPDCLSPPNVPHVRRQVSLVRAAGLHGGASLRGGSLLPQGVFPLLDLRLHAASGRTRLRFQTWYVPRSAFRKWFQCSELAAASSGRARIVSLWCSQ